MWRRWHVSGQFSLGFRSAQNLITAPTISGWCDLTRYDIPKGVPLLTCKGLSCLNWHQDCLKMWKKSAQNRDASELGCFALVFFSATVNFSYRSWQALVIVNRRSRNEAKLVLSATTKFPIQSTDKGRFVYFSYFWSISLWRWTEFRHTKHKLVPLGVSEAKTGACQRPGRTVINTAKLDEKIVWKHHHSEWQGGHTPRKTASQVGPATFCHSAMTSLGTKQKPGVIQSPMCLTVMLNHPSWSLNDLFSESCSVLCGWFWFRSFPSLLGLPDELLTWVEEDTNEADGLPDASYNLNLCVSSIIKEWNRGKTAKSLVPFGDSRTEKEDNCWLVHVALKNNFRSAVTLPFSKHKWRFQKAMITLCSHVEQCYCTKAAFVCRVVATFTPGWLHATLAFQHTSST